MGHMFSNVSNAHVSNKYECVKYRLSDQAFKKQTSNAMCLADTVGQVNSKCEISGSHSGD
jgi:hypothetical protein